jgi:hypothetical protein
LRTNYYIKSINKGNFAKNEIPNSRRFCCRSCRYGSSCRTKLCAARRLRYAARRTSCPAENQAIAEDDSYNAGGLAHKAFAEQLDDAGRAADAIVAVHAPCPRQDVEWCKGWDAFAVVFDAAYAEQAEKIRVRREKAAAELRAANDRFIAEQRASREAEMRDRPARKIRYYNECMDSQARLRASTLNITPYDDRPFCKDQAEAYTSTGR